LLPVLGDLCENHHYCSLLYTNKVCACMLKLCVL
jgi:hypothetical protein